MASNSDPDSIFTTVLFTIGALVMTFLLLAASLSGLWYDARLCFTGHEETVTVVDTHIKTTTRRGKRSYLWFDIVINGTPAAVELSKYVPVGGAVNVLYEPSNPRHALEKDPNATRFSAVFLRLHGMPLWMPAIWLCMGLFTGFFAWCGVAAIYDHLKSKAKTSQ